MIRYTIAAIAALSAGAALAYEQPPRDNNWLDYSAGAFATNAICGPVFSREQLATSIELAAGQAGVAPAAIRTTLEARILFFTANLRQEMPTAEARAQWCNEMLRVTRQ